MRRRSATCSRDAARLSMTPVPGFGSKVRWRPEPQTSATRGASAPLIISAVGMYFFYTRIAVSNSLPGLILVHTALATPFVVIVVTATLSGFDHSLTRAGASLGAPPQTVFFKVILPLILPGVISGALFACVTSFDESTVVLFIAGPEQRTLPKQMFSGIREVISPTITAAATLLILFAITMLTTIELLRRRSERLRGIRG